MILDFQNQVPNSLVLSARNVAGGAVRVKGNPRQLKEPAIKVTGIRVGAYYAATVGGEAKIGTPLLMESNGSGANATLTSASQIKIRLIADTKELDEDPVPLPLYGGAGVQDELLKYEWFLRNVKNLYLEVTNESVVAVDVYMILRGYVGS